MERIRSHDILVVGSFIIGLESDRPGVGRMIAEAASDYGVDNMNVLFLAPLPGTRLWKQLAAEDRIALKHLTRDQVIREMNECKQYVLFGREHPLAAESQPHRGTQSPVQPGE